MPSLAYLNSYARPSDQMIRIVSAERSFANDKSCAPRRLC